MNTKNIVKKLFLLIVSAGGFISSITCSFQIQQGFYPDQVQRETFQKEESLAHLTYQQLIEKVRELYAENPDNMNDAEFNNWHNKVVATTQNTTKFFGEIEQNEDYFLLQ